MSDSLPPLHFLTASAEYTDYRPAIGPGGDVVIFERTPVGGGPITLCKITDLAAPDPVPFLSGASLPRFQTRPDFCWRTDRVAFNGRQTSNSPIIVWNVGADGRNPARIDNTRGYVYPTWSRDGTLLVTENQGPAASPNPSNTVFDLSGGVVYANINGTAMEGVDVFGGMPAVGQYNLPMIAFAGQPALKGWGGSTSPDPVYDQEKNYIFLNRFDQNGIFFSGPVEPEAPVKSFNPHYQGRAPSFSPNGATIAFESNRPSPGSSPGSSKGYGIYLCNVRGPYRTITQVTDPALGAQHAKFFPSGTKLILCANHPGGDPPTMGIAWVDISGLLKS